MNTPTTNHNYNHRKSTPYIQPSDSVLDSSAAVIDALLVTPIDHHVRRADVLQAPTPTTFEEYQKWLHNWRAVWHREVMIRQLYRRARSVYMKAGGTGRQPQNITGKMTASVSSLFAKALTLMQRHHDGINLDHAVPWHLRKKVTEAEKLVYVAREWDFWQAANTRAALHAMRVERKPIGKVLWEKRSNTTPA